MPAWGLVLQGVWAALLVLPRTVRCQDEDYGNLYSDLLDYIISAALLFYMLTIAGVFRLRLTRPDAERPYRAVRLSGGAGTVSDRRDRHCRCAGGVSTDDDVARHGHRLPGIAGVFPVETKALRERFSMIGLPISLLLSISGSFRLK